MDTANLIVSIIAIVIDSILAGVAIYISIKAIRQTKTQIELSNKHQLFDRRLEKYSVIKSLVSRLSVVQCYCDNKLDIKGKEKTVLELLLECSLLNDAVWAVRKPEEERAYQTINEKTQLLEYISEEISVIFDGEEATLFSSFVYEYHLLVFFLNQFMFWKCFDDEKAEQEKYTEEACTHYVTINRLLDEIRSTAAEKKILAQVKI